MRYCIMLLLSIFTFLTLTAKDNNKLGVVNQAINDTIRIQLQITNPSCNGFNNGQILAIPSGGRFPYTYAWSNGSKGAAIFGLKEGAYSVTITDALGIRATATGSIVQPQPINIQFASNGDICEGTAIDYQANVTGGTSPYQFLWSNGNTSNTLSPDTSGTYFVTVTDANNCSTVGTLSVKAPFSVEVVTQPVQCFDFCDGSAQAVVTGGTRPYRYQWNNGSTSAILESLPVGTYTVTVTDANGCEAIASGTVTAPPDLQLNLLLTGTCDANSAITASVNPEGGIAPYFIRWRVGNGDSIVSGVNTISNLVRGRIYGVTVTDQNGCRAIEDNIVVPLTSGLLLDVNKRDIACAENNTGLASVTPLERNSTLHLSMEQWCYYCYHY
ncbi:MAG: hypothetical protein HC892_17635 [Saprospiraceae bacterium]|nr:hypothetical protein [Saprospiraceae bacterium]